MVLTPASEHAAMCDVLSALLGDLVDVRDAVRSAGFCEHRGNSTAITAPSRRYVGTAFYHSNMITTSVRTRMLMYVCAAVHAHPFAPRAALEIVGQRMESETEQVFDWIPFLPCNIRTCRMDDMVNVRRGASVYIRDPFRAGGDVKVAIRTAVCVHIITSVNLGAAAHGIDAFEEEEELGEDDEANGLNSHGFSKTRIFATWYHFLYPHKASMGASTTLQCCAGCTQWRIDVLCCVRAILARWRRLIEAAMSIQQLVQSGRWRGTAGSSE